ncbi:MAG: glucose-6-phosphate dehydrogenase [Anaerolineales bacterium]|nr:glucose-6-phosphate dehydrogenase [Anaerolineales bacterium]
MSERTTLVIFGASGDLAWRKLVPALYSLHVKQRLPAGFAIVGVARSDYGDDTFRERLASGVQEFAAEHDDAAHWAEFAERISYVTADLSMVNDMRRVDAHVRQLEDGAGQRNRLYYLSVAPRLYETAVANLGAADMIAEADGWRHVIIEKPFGHDLASARALNAAIHRVLRERQIYRIDHYLGKETVQNLLVFRFANALFEPVWNRNYIDHVQITAAETVDVGHRAGYYDGVGVVRDMVQNHMMQLLSLVAMEPPASFDAEALRNEQVKVLSAIRPIREADVAQHTVRGQYHGYREAEGVGSDSETATFAAIRFYIDNWRWQGVPFYLRSGKALADKSTEITIFFKRPPHLMFPLPEGARLEANHLSICIQPDEGIHFSFQAKVPDTAAGMRPVDMAFHYDDAFGPAAMPDAYERLLFDALKGDPALFTRGDAIELAWQLIDPILAGWAGAAAPPLATYEPGSWGPEAAAELVAHDGYAWERGCGQHGE